MFLKIFKLVQVITPIISHFSSHVCCVPPASGTNLGAWEASAHPFIIGKAFDPDFSPQADHPVTNFRKARDFTDEIGRVERCWEPLKVGETMHTILFGWEVLHFWGTLSSACCRFLSFASCRSVESTEELQLHSRITELKAEFIVHLPAL